MLYGPFYHPNKKWSWNIDADVSEYDSKRFFVSQKCWIENCVIPSGSSKQLNDIFLSFSKIFPHPDIIVSHFRHASWILYDSDLWLPPCTSTLLWSGLTFPSMRVCDMQTTDVQFHYHYVRLCKMAVAGWSFKSSFTPLCFIDLKVWASWWVWSNIKNRWSRAFHSTAHVFHTVVTSGAAFKLVIHQVDSINQFYSRLWFTKWWG